MYRLKLCSVPSIDRHIQRNKPGQTRSPVIRTEIQTCHNINTNPRSYHLLLVDWYIDGIDILLE